MKQLQQFSDDPNVMIPSIDLFLQCIEKLPLPYTGNKKKLLRHMYDAIVKHGIKFNSVVDAFSGSATVSLLFKSMGKTVISNDILTSSYLNSVAFVENPGIRITDEERHFLLYNKNTNQNDFVKNNYLGTQFRATDQVCRFNKFTTKECEHLDNFRANIDELCGINKQSLGLISNAAVVMRLPFGNVDQSADIMTHRHRQDNEYGDKKSAKYDRRIGIYYDDDYNLDFNKWFAKYLQDFVSGVKQQPEKHNEKIKRASFLVNLQQHVLRDCFVGGRMNHGQAIAEMTDRLEHQKNQLKAHWSNQGSTEMDFFTQAGVEWEDGKPGQGMKWWDVVDSNLPGRCMATNMDATQLLKGNICNNIDLAYFDPPYGGNSSSYSTIYRFLEEYVYSQPLEELPHIVNANKFVKKKHYETHFTEMLDAARRIPVWLFSYNDDSWKDIDYIVSIIKQYKSNVVVETLTDNYRYLYRKRQARDSKSSEYLIIAN